MLRLSGVSVVYSNTLIALHPTNLRFEEGRFTVLLGPSGAGKSTLLRTLNGLVRPSEGDVSRSGMASIFADARTLRRHRLSTGMIFQQHHLIGRLTVLSNVLLGRLGARGTLRSLLPAPRAERLHALGAIERVGLLARALDRADRLSGGQQQRIGIARAMAQRPRIVLADEPVASLDPAGGVRVLSDFHRVCREDGLTAVVSLHQVEFARRFADRIVGLAGGRVVFDDAPERLGRDAVDRIYGEPRLLTANAAE